MESASNIKPCFYCMSLQSYSERSNFYRVMTGSHKKWFKICSGDSMVYSYRDNTKSPKILQKIGPRTQKPRGVSIYDGHTYTCYIQVFWQDSLKSPADSVPKLELSSGDFKNYVDVIKLCHITLPYMLY